MNPPPAVDTTPSPATANHDCQTCFQCEANCPVDALFVSSYTEPQLPLDEPTLVGHGLLGSYRERIGWGKGRTLGSKIAIGPSLRPSDAPFIS